MSKQLASAALAAFVAGLLLSGMPEAEAKQHCSATKQSSSNGKWWSYRLIDGRKCWYEGKPGLSKALLEWPRTAAAGPSPRESTRPSRRDVANEMSGNRGNPLDAQAWAQKEAVQPWVPEEAVQARTPDYVPDTFDALWTARIWLLNR